uniref:Uncharacterized protein n=1 Tax=Sander lucioperca TaxID=283035 RepID=A0A8C9XTA9_SANLU
MVIYCCVVGCANRQGKANIYFYRLSFDGERRQLLKALRSAPVYGDTPFTT